MSPIAILTPRRALSAVAVIGLVAAAGLLLAALPGPDAKELANLQEEVTVALHEIDNFGRPGRFDQVPDHAVVEGLRRNARAAFAKYLSAPLVAQWSERAEIYFSRLDRGEDKTVKKGVTYSDWDFEVAQLSGDTASFKGVATKCNPYIDFGTNPPSEGNPCAPVGFTVVMTKVEGTWVISSLSIEQLAV